MSPLSPVIQNTIPVSPNPPTKISWGVLWSFTTKGPPCNPPAPAALSTSLPLPPQANPQKSLSPSSPTTHGPIALPPPCKFGLRSSELEKTTLPLHRPRRRWRKHKRHERRRG